MIIPRSLAFNFCATLLFSAFENEEKIDLLFNGFQQYQFTEKYNNVSFNFGYYLPYNLSWLAVKSFNSNFSVLKIPQYLTINSSGDKLYRETNIRIKTGILLNNRTSIFIHFENYFINIKNYGSEKCFTGGYSIILESNENLKFLIEMNNIIQVNKSSISDEIPTPMRLHCYYNSKLNHIFEYGISKDPLYPLNQIIKWTNQIGDFFITSGFITEPKEIFITGGLRLNYLNLNIDLLYNPHLGISTGINIGI